MPRGFRFLPATHSIDTFRIRLLNSSFLGRGAETKSSRVRSSESLSGTQAKGVASSFRRNRWASGAAAVGVQV